MNNATKTQLMDWFTGNFTPQTQPSDLDTFKGLITKNLSFMLSPLGSDTEIINAVQITSPNGNNSTWIVVLLWNNTTKRGGFALLDENFTQKALLTQYDSGVNIGRIDNLQVDEEGRIYAVEFRPSEERVRFLYLTNFLIKIGDEYKVDIRKAYNLPINWETLTTLYNRATTQMYKIPNVAKYCIILKYENTQVGQGAEGYDIVIMEISVESGTTFKYTRMIPPTTNVTYKPFVSWDNNNLFTIISYSLTTGSGISMLFKITNVEKAEYSDNMWFTPSADFINLSKDLNIPINSDCYSIDSNNLLITHIGTNKLIFSKIAINNTTGTVTDVKEYDESTTNVQVIFTECNGYLYAYTCCEDNVDYEEAFIHIMNKTTSISSNDFNKSIIRSTTGGGEHPSFFGTKFFLVQNNFNLYKYYACNDFAGLYVIPIQIEIYNENNYNGSVYFGDNMFIGNQGYIYNSEGINFARNLYNKTIQDNKTTYSLEVPNNMLNDYPLSIQQLIGETKFTLEHNTKPITKNIYEDLIINFINAISIVNKIDEDRPIYFKNGASRLNDSISNTKDYDDSKMTKYRINYSDNTNEIGLLTITNVNSFKYNLSFSLQPTKQISSIDFISDDENTIYNTITPTLELNKHYDLSVDVHIE